MVSSKSCFCYLFRFGTSFNVCLHPTRRLESQNMAINRKHLCSLVFCIVSTLSISLVAQTTQETASPESHGIAVDNMDRSVQPGDDFYDYANGDWIKRTELPPDRGG